MLLQIIGMIFFIMLVILGSRWLFRGTAGMRPCKTCGKEIAKSARHCPHCGGYVWHPIEVKAVIILIVFIILLYWWLSTLNSGMFGL